jgi:hypothetical protein
VAAEAGAAEGDPRPVYTWAGPSGSEMSLVRSYTPSDGGVPRLVANVGDGVSLCVWDTGTGAFWGALQGDDDFCSLVTYNRASDDRPRVVAGTIYGQLCVWDGDDLQVLHTVEANADERPLHHLAVYEEPTGDRTRLVTG